MRAAGGTAPLVPSMKVRTLRTSIKLRQPEGSGVSRSITNGCWNPLTVLLKTGAAIIVAGGSPQSSRTDRGRRPDMLPALVAIDGGALHDQHFGTRCMKPVAGWTTLVVDHRSIPVGVPGLPVVIDYRKPAQIAFVGVARQFRSTISPPGPGNRQGRRVRPTGWPGCGIGDATVMVDRQPGRA